eukprot:13210507-Heterocapsa_arctica.AAC.1
MATQPTLLKDLFPRALAIETARALPKVESTPKSLALRVVLKLCPDLFNLQARAAAILVLLPIRLVLTLILQSLANRAETRP